MLLLFASCFLTFQVCSVPKLVPGILTTGCPVLLSVKLREAEGWVV